MITITDLTVDYNGIQALDHVDLTMRRGDFLVLFGADDSGKTTLLYILMGIRTKYKGTVQIFGRNANEWSAKERARVRFVPDDILWERHMTAEMYLRFAESAAADYDEILQQELCSEFAIPLKSRLLDLTYQENKFVQITAAVCAKPELLILDEPMNFLSASGYRKLLNWLQRWNKQGMSIFLAAEKYGHADGYGKSYGYLKEGKLLAAGKISPEDIRWKVITTTKGAPQEFQKAMDQCIGEQKQCSRYLYRGDMKRLPELLALLAGADFVVEAMTLEEELSLDFSRWE